MQLTSAVVASTSRFESLAFDAPPQPKLPATVFCTYLPVCLTQRNAMPCHAMPCTVDQPYANSSAPCHAPSPPMTIRRSHQLASNVVVPMPTATGTVVWIATKNFRCAPILLPCPVPASVLTLKHVRTHEAALRRSLCCWPRSPAADCSPASVRTSGTPLALRRIHDA
jgi:hypothetical protein